MLPKKWAIRRKTDNYKEINAYFSKLNNREYSANGSWEENFVWHKYDFLVFPHTGASTYVVRRLPKGYKEITWEVFQREVLMIKENYEIY